MQKTTVLVALLTVLIACLCLGCDRIPYSAEISEEDDLIKLAEEITEVIYAANKAAFDMCVQGFDEELKEENKKPFAYYEPSLRKWYSESMTARLESFYNHHLGEWGYEMGFAFPLHTKELAEEGFLSLEQETATKAAAKFKEQVGHEEYCITLYTLEKQEDGSWLIIKVE